MGVSNLCRVTYTLQCDGRRPGVELVISHHESNAPTTTLPSHPQVCGPSNVKMGRGLFITTLLFVCEAEMKNSGHFYSRMRLTAAVNTRISLFRYY